MVNTEYQELASRTESVDFPLIAKRLATVRAIRLLHGALGVSSESGEIADQLKKHLFYGKPLDTTNLAEEIGDVFWYLALLSNELGINFDQIMKLNIAKLQKRYGDKFSEQRAVERNLEIERGILEGAFRPYEEGRDEWDAVICDRCGIQANEIPFYCENCGEDLAKGGGVVRLQRADEM
jgi:NTP pyrophosphatase (non-canonical NTP hydrolase)